VSVVTSSCGPALRLKTGGQLGSGVVKTKVHVIGFSVLPLYRRAFVVVSLPLS
jgi:hypothetical protein